METANITFPVPNYVACDGGSLMRLNLHETE